MASHVHDVLDDDQLLGALGAAMSARRTVPARYVQMATNAYAWHNIDAELARLSHDPGPDPGFLPRGHADQAAPDPVDGLGEGLVGWQCPDYAMSR